MGKFAKKVAEQATVIAVRNVAGAMAVAAAADPNESVVIGGCSLVTYGMYRVIKDAFEGKYDE